MIWYVEDDSAIRDIGMYALDSAGFKTRGFEDGLSCYEALKNEKPDLIISCGAAVAVPFFYIGKMMGAKLVYIEVFDRIDKPTMTGKMVYPIVDKFVVQWEEQKKVYPKAVNLGSIF